MTVSKIRWLRDYPKVYLVTILLPLIPTVVLWLLGLWPWWMVSGFAVIIAAVLPFLQGWWEYRQF